MTKHTPGPWTTVGEDTLNGVLCSVVQAIKRSTNGNSVEAFCPGANRRANARLIAAAPELLAALEYMVSAQTQPFDHADRRTSIKSARAAIAKATE